MGAVDWLSWHEAYDVAGSPLSRRLQVVQSHVHRWLDERPGEDLTAVSACAGQGRDLLGVLASRVDARRVRATLLEQDQRNVDIARAARDRAALTDVVVATADAGDRAAYVAAVPADLVLMVGVFGNIDHGDVRRTVAALPELCAPRATVIWTCTRRPPDRTPDVRSWFAGADFDEQAFYAPDDALFSVGVHRLIGDPRPFDPVGRIFTFTDCGKG